MNDYQPYEMDEELDEGFEVVLYLPEEIRAGYDTEEAALSQAKTTFDDFPIAIVFNEFKDPIHVFIGGHEYILASSK